MSPSLPPQPGETRRSRRIRFPGGNGFELAGIIDLPAGPLQRTAGDVQRTAGDVQPAAAVHWSADGSLSTGTPVVVFSHCFTCNKDLKAIVRLGRALASAGIAVLRYDMTGLGGSDGDFSQTDFSSNLADLRAAIAAAQRELGPVSGLLGHSFGGAASLAVCGDEPGPPASIRAVAALAAPSETRHLAELMVRMNPAIQTHGQGEVQIGGRRWLIRREMLEDFRRYRLERRISQIRIPLMLIHSSSDRTVGFDHAVRIQRLASMNQEESPSGAVSLVALDGADHLLAENPADLSYVAGVLSAFFWRYHDSGELPRANRS